MPPRGRPVRWPPSPTPRSCGSATSRATRSRSSADRREPAPGRSEPEISSWPRSPPSRCSTSSRRCRPCRPRARARPVLRDLRAPRGLRESRATRVLRARLASLVLPVRWDYRELPGSMVPWACPARWARPDLPVPRAMPVPRALPDPRVPPAAMVPKDPWVPRDCPVPPVRWVRRVLLAAHRMERPVLRDRPVQLAPRAPREIPVFKARAARVAPPARRASRAFRDRRAIPVLLAIPVRRVPQV